jgi:hypothetical protein
MSRGSKLRRALCRARDMYARGVTGCARYLPADAAFGYPVIVPASLSRSRSAAGYGWTGPEEDLRQLVRAASQRRVEQRRAEMRASTTSRSVAAVLSVARIDEDAPCEFGDVDGGAGALHVRSQSCVGGGEGLARSPEGGGVGMTCWPFARLRHLLSVPQCAWGRVVPPALGVKLRSCELLDFLGKKTLSCWIIMGM